MAAQVCFTFGNDEDWTFDVFVRDHRQLPPMGGLPTGTQAWFTVENAAGDFVLSATLEDGDISVIDPVKAILRISVPRAVVRDTVEILNGAKTRSYAGSLAVETPSPNAWFSEQVVADITVKRSIGRAHGVTG
jgi:hypothetical protein